MMSATSAAAAGSIAPAALSAARSWLAGRSTRSDRQVPAAATGGSTACSRTANPPAPMPVSSPSTHGCASSRRRPAASASRCANRRTAASSGKRISLRRKPLPSSTQTASGAVTNTSVVPSAHSSGSRMPAPVSSVCRVRRLASTSVSPSIPPDSARIAAATTDAGSGAPSGTVSPASRSRTRSISELLTPPCPFAAHRPAAARPAPGGPPPRARTAAPTAGRRAPPARRVAAAP
ncbi:hypothetical protein PICSAR71_02049 [Mycobacterium avium subsp. paratuberculosis]|nr:hypothetical protein PICSAR71_02049 [Mycobacterium avium subsp. paratuberculosis]